MSQKEVDITYSSKKEIWSDKTRKALVSNKNVILYYYYLKYLHNNKQTKKDLSVYLFNEILEIACNF